MADPFDMRREATYGVPEVVAPDVRRITCENPSPYTFTGTQTYLIGTEEVAVIDPGPDNPAHLAALRKAIGTARVSHIFVTHSHRDHSPGARVLAADTGAEIFAFGEHGTGISNTMQALIASGADLGGGEGADDVFAPDQRLAHSDRIEGANWVLVALHTPGHLSNHLSFVLEGTGIVFTGDTVMGFATTLVSPPDGDMAAFMASLRMLQGRSGDRLYLPGHGHAVNDPHAMLAHQIAHREKRFDQIIGALSDGPAKAHELAARIYTDIDPVLLPAAARNVLASLIGLADEGRIEARGMITAETAFGIP
ncbi:MAG: MBL fold metallo-hydrolase [Paracoccaceae bacterium]